MTKVKTSKLIDIALDWAVAKCEFEGCEDWDGTLDGVDCVSDLQGAVYAPSTNWAQGGPIIDREHIGLLPSGNAYYEIDGGTYYSYGPTPLIAAMRCYVMRRFGDEIEIPQELFE